jgi:hypothetical protein
MYNNLEKTGAKQIVFYFNVLSLHSPEGLKICANTSISLVNNSRKGMNCCLVDTSQISFCTSELAPTLCGCLLLFFLVHFINLILLTVCTSLYMSILFVHP